MAEYAIPDQTESLRVIDRDGHVWTREQNSLWWNSFFNDTKHSAPWADLLRIRGPVRDAPKKPDYDSVRRIIFAETSSSFSVEKMTQKILQHYEDWINYAITRKE